MQMRYLLGEEVGGSYIPGGFNTKGSKFFLHTGPLTATETQLPPAVRTGSLHRLLTGDPTYAHALPTYFPVPELPGCNSNK